MKRTKQSTFAKRERKEKATGFAPVASEEMSMMDPMAAKAKKSEQGAKPQTNITAEHKALFDAVTSGKYDNFALFSCFVDGKPTSAIVSVVQDGEEYNVTPLFVAVTADMVVTDHEGAQA